MPACRLNGVLHQVGFGTRPRLSLIQSSTASVHVPNRFLQRERRRRTMFDCLHVSMLDQAIAGRSAASLLSSTTRMRNDVPPEATSGDAVSGSTTPVRARGGRIASVPPWPLNNAAKYTPPGGVLRAESYVEDGQIRVVIDDNGIGMSEALMARAFDLFAQAERTADRAQGGLGIGLAVVKRLVELHDATINASSAGLGKGSRFTLVFPKIAQDHALGPLAPVPESSVQQGSLKIMVVDDNVDACAPSRRRRTPS